MCFDPVGHAQARTQLFKQPEPKPVAWYMRDPLGAFVAACGAALLFLLVVKVFSLVGPL